MQFKCSERSWIWCRKTLVQVEDYARLEPGKSVHINFQRWRLVLGGKLKLEDGYGRAPCSASRRYLQCSRKVESRDSERLEVSFPCTESLSFCLDSCWDGASDNDWRFFTWMQLEWGSGWHQSKFSRWCDSRCLNNLKSNLQPVITHVSTPADEGSGEWWQLVTSMMVHTLWAIIARLELQ